MTSSNVYRLLCDLFPKEQYAILPEVANSTGSNRKRHIDAVVMSLYPSRGLDIYGIEIKVSRSDWVRERDNPAKAEEIANHCDGFYLAVSDASIVHAGELPTGWGLISCSSGEAKIVTRCTKTTPSNLSRGFVAAMLRRAQEYTRPDELAQEIRHQESLKQSASWEAWAKKQVEQARKEATECAAAVNKLSDELGINLRGFLPGGGGWMEKDRNLAAAKASLLASRNAEQINSQIANLEHAAREALRAMGDVRKQLVAQQDAIAGGGA